MQKLESSTPAATESNEAATNKTCREHEREFGHSDPQSRHCGINLLCISGLKVENFTGHRSTDQLANSNYSWI